jgi:hypothetical protein
MTRAGFVPTAGMTDIGSCVATPVRPDGRAPAAPMGGRTLWDRHEALQLFEPVLHDDDLRRGG